MSKNTEQMIAVFNKLSNTMAKRTDAAADQIIRWGDNMLTRTQCGEDALLPSIPEPDRNEHDNISGDLLLLMCLEKAIENNGEFIFTEKPTSQDEEYLKTRKEQLPLFEQAIERNGLSSCYLGEMDWNEASGKL